MRDARLPRWIRALLGVGCAAAGAVLLVQPFDSLAALTTVIAVGALLLGISAFVESRSAPTRWPGLATAAVWVAVAVAVATASVTTTVLALLVGVALIINGALEIVAGLRGTTDERLASIIGGVASIVFGALAIGWPSVTALVIAVVFGFKLMLFGLRLAWSSIRLRGDTARQADVNRPKGRVRRLGHLVGTVAALALSLVLAGVSAQLNEGEPIIDSFYDPPSDVPEEPGQLLAVESFTRTIPDDANAWRILYTTTRSDGEPAVASALVVVPAQADGPLPAIALAHGTTGVHRKCAPSLLPDPFEAGAFFALDRVIDEGWALVATDYVGLGTAGGHPYLVGEPVGRSVLDSVRAARAMQDIELGDDTVVWGHSQGGGAALWTGGLASSYAPDAGVIGVAALAPASDAVGLAENLSNVTGGTIFSSYLVQGYANAYDDVEVDDYVRDAARASFDASVGRCLAEPSALLSVIGAVTLGSEVFSTDLNSGALGARLEENVATMPIETPLLLAQGEADSLVAPTVQDAYVQARCTVGQSIDYRTYPGLDHVPLVEPDSPLLPELVEWTRDRFDGNEPTPTC